MNLNAITLAITRPGGVRSWAPLSLFTAGVNGAWYDPSDVNLTWRRNLLTYTEQFDNAAWLKGSSSISPDSVLSPDNTLTADKLVESTATAPHSVSIVTAPTFYSGLTYSFSIYVKAGERFRGLITLTTDTVSFGSIVTASFNLQAETITAGTGSPSVSILSVGDGWYRLTVSKTAIATATAVGHGLRLGDSAGVTTYAGDGISGIYIWGAQLELGSTATPYQRITDGVQDYLQYQAQPVLFQDAAGTTPVTAVEQPVGLMLDKSKGLVLGPELVTNGDFSSATGWIFGSNWTISGGKASQDSSLGTGFLERPITMSAGVSYQVSVDVDAIVPASGNFSVRFIVGGVSTIIQSYTTPGIKTFVYTPSSAVTQIRLALNASGGSVTIDNISVRELPGNHAFNSSGNSANFPVLSARYNLLTKTEDFSDAAWSKSNQIATNTAIAPDGLQTADTFDVAVNGSSIYATTSCIPNTSYTFSFFVRLDTLSVSEFKFAVRDDTAGVFIATDVVPSIQLSSTSWAQVKYTFTTPTGCLLVRPYIFRNTTITTGKFYIWGADLRVANDALNQPVYQRVNTATDYDTVGFKPYLKFNGTNQWLQTSSIDFSYGDKMFVSAGVRKLSSTNYGMLVELSASAVSNTGAFSLFAPYELEKYRFDSKGTITSPVYSNAFAAPITQIASAIGDISGDRSILRVNGTQVASSTADQGTGTYGNYPLYIGARAGTSLWFNGRLHQLVVAGKEASDSEIGQTEAFTNQKTGAY